MRRVWIVLAGVLTAIGLVGVGVGVGPAGAKTSKPVNVDGKVNVKGTKDVSSKSAATIDMEADDYYFGPTFVKVKPGEKVTIELENEGNASHTFTSDSLGVDEQVAAGKKAKFTVTVPSDGTAFEFHCSFHEDMGMQGAFFTKKGGTAQ
jgi:plastocyanin